MSFTLLFIGILCLSLSMDKHYKPLFKRLLQTKTRNTLKMLGWYFVGGSMAILLAFHPNISLSLVDWLAYVSVDILFISLFHCTILAKAR
jgi:hypothetical protein